MTKLDRRSALKVIGATAMLGVGGTGLAAHPDEEGFAPPQKFVLIHGAWHGAFAWDGVASGLRLAGHEVEVPTLPSMHPGDNRFGIQFSDYVDAVVDVLRRQDRQVILVGHSSAGMLLQAAAPRVAEAIKLLVFSNAFVVANGQSQLDNIPSDVAAALTALSQSTPDNTVPIEPLFSFHPVKHITTGEGGMVTTPDPKLFYRMRADNIGVQVHLQSRREDAGVQRRQSGWSRARQSG